MALQKQQLPLTISNGLDTKSDEKNVLVTNWLAAENVDYTKTGQVSKRGGFDPLPSGVDGSVEITSGKAISTLSDELVQYSNNKLYSYSPSRLKWYDKGYVSSATVSQKTVDVALSSVFAQEFTTISGVSFYAYQGSADAATNYIKVRITDDTSGTVVAEHTITDPNAVLLKVAQISKACIIIYRKNTVVRFRYITFAAPTVLSDAVNIGNTAVDIADCILINNRLFVAWKDFTAGIDLVYIDTSLTPTFPLNLAYGATSYISLSLEGSSNLRLTIGDSTALFDYNLTVLTAPVTYASGFSATNAASIQDPNNANTSIIVYHKNADAAQIGVKAARVTSAGVVTDLGYLLYGVNLVSKIQLLGGQLYFMVHKKFNTGSGGETRGYFLASFNKQLVAQVASGVALKKGDYNLSSLQVVGETLAWFSSEYYQVFNTVTPSVRTPTTVARYLFDFSSANNFYDAVLGKQLHTAGGMLYSYDSNKVVEHGFLEIPPAPELASIDCAPSTGVAITAKQYRIVYAWNDSQGQIHRSAPSLPATITATDSTTKIAVTFKPLTLTSKANVEVEIYATEGLGTKFYKVSALRGLSSAENSLVLNDPSVPTQTFLDIAPDSEIISKELLYTTGGVLENIAPITSKYVVTYKNRLVLLSSDGNSLQYSKLFETNVGVGFNDALQITLDSFGGPGTALAVIDDNLIIFKERALFLLTGEGPNNLGTDDDFRRPALITSDVGCIDAGSVVSVPGGLMFKSEKGIYMLSRGLQVEYVGSSVERYNSMVITSGTLLNTVNQVRFTTQGSTVLVYDYFHKRWSTYENLQAVDALMFQGVYTVLRPSGLVLKQSGYSDNGSYVPIVLESAWVQFAGVQAFQRFYKMLVLGNYINAHKVKVSFAYNFENVYTQEAVIDSTTLFAGTVYGDGNYGDGVYGGPVTAYQYQVMPKIQKCQSFKFRIETLYDGVLGADATLSNFLIEIGAMPSVYKARAAVKVGAGS